VTATTAGRQHYNVTLAVLALAALSYALLQTMVAPALPEIQHELGASPSTVTWVLTIYLLSASICTPILGRLGDMFGKEHMLVVVLALFGLGSLISALSNSLGLLVAGRAVQGAAGAVFPLAFGIIRDEFPRERVATGIGLVVVVIAMIATHLWVPESPIKSPARVDYVGAVLLSAALSALLLAVSEGNRWGWSSPAVIGLFVGAAVLIAVWVWFEQRVRQPLVDIALLRVRGVWTTNLTALLIGFGMFGSFILVPQFVQMPVASGYGFGVGVTGAGLFLLPSTVVMLVAGPLAGELAGRVGSKVPLLIGTACASLSFVLLALEHSAKWHIVVAVGLLGLGIGLSFASMANLIVEAVPQHQTGEATGMNTIMRTVGGAFGAQIAAAIITSHVEPGTDFPAESGFTAAFVLSAASVAVAFAAATLIPGRRRPAPPPPHESSALDRIPDRDSPVSRERAPLR
jgi:MFS family permease